LERHATSKIAAAEDIENIGTLGFRGEAIPSIAAVSRFTLVTREADAPSGTRIEIAGGKIISVQEVGAAPGTTVEVRSLFFNLPARRKFLRSASSELGPVVNYVTQAALGAPGVRFTLIHGGRETIACPPVATLRERAFQLFGKKMVDRLMDVKAEEGEGRIDGLASLPLAGRPDKTVQHFFVNGRPVKDRILMAALSQAYSGVLERGRSPEAFLFLRLPLGDVDVNVHPAKAEVRFRDTQLVFRLVLRAIGEGVSRGHIIKAVVPAGAEGAPASRIAEGQAGYQAPGLAFGPVAEGDMYRRYVSPFLKPSPPGQVAPEPGQAGPVVLGQYANMYIVAAAEDGLVVIDQHNAHERVLYEKYREIDRLKAWPRKALLIPPIFDLSPSATAAYEANIPLFEELGFRIEPMGGRSYALKEYPELSTPDEAEDVFLSLVEEAGKKPLEERRDHMLATMACKSAVKAGEPLTREKMGFLVAELFKTSRPALCPHGRPIVVRVERSTIDKGLGR
jgi:DNA mismatch repair protein MutL